MEATRRGFGNPAPIDPLREVFAREEVVWPLGRLLGAIVLGGLILFARAGNAQLTQTVISGPVGSGPSAFGQTVAFLPNGNFVVSDPYFDLPNAVDAGAVHLYRGSDNALIATLTGTGSFQLVGYSDFDDPGVIVLPSGHYLVRASNWNGAAGAVTWCDGATGCSGVVSATNSAVGSTSLDFLGSYIKVLSNGNYLVGAYAWDDPAGPFVDAGAIRLCNGETGCFGPMTPANSLIGSGENQRVGDHLTVVALTNGNYVVETPFWGTPSTPEAGAATFCSGVTGCVGEISASNSLVGTTSGDRVGLSVTPLSDGSYVVQSPQWTKGAVVGVGAATWCDGTTGCPPGPVTAANSLTGASLLEIIGGDVVDENGVFPRPVLALPGGAYVVKSPWASPPGAPRVGAVTWCGAGGGGCTGATVTAANSLAGSTAGDLQRAPSMFAVGTGAFVVPAPKWDDPTSLAHDVGAAVYCDSVTHCQGQSITVANSLVGSNADDNVASASVTPLANGNYVVNSPSWRNGGLSAAGAATFCSGTSGCQGSVSPANSLVGASANDQVAYFTRALSNGHYVVPSRFTHGGPDAYGAVTFCSGTTGCAGTPSAANSLVGTTSSDRVGIYGVHPLPDGNYLVANPLFSDGPIAAVGAVTWCSGTSGCAGPITTSNSLLGVTASDNVGSVTVLDDDRWAVRSSFFDDGSIVDAGAVSIGHGAVAMTGRVDDTNSVFGSVTGDLRGGISYDPARERFLVGAPTSHRVVLVELPEPAVGLALVAGSSALGLLERRRRRGDPVIRRASSPSSPKPSRPESPAS